jgi:Bacteriophage abortive infection AbiH
MQSLGCIGNSRIAPHDGCKTFYVLGNLTLGIKNGVFVSDEILYIIGNGFDIYHGIQSRYSDFKGYLSDSDQTLYDLVEEFISVEENWSNLEQALANIEVDNILDYVTQFLESYGAEDWSDAYHHDYQYEVSKIVEGVSQGLKSRFIVWIAQLHITNRNEVKTQLLDLDKSAKYLTFNHTSTLSTIYEIQKANVLFIHGDIESQNQDIVLGHACNPSEILSLNDVPDPGSLDARVMEGNEIINEYFGRTFKNTPSIIDANKLFFSSLSGISEINILGHSLSDVDIAYFKTIIENIDTDKVHWHISYYENDELTKHKNTMNALGIDNSKLCFCVLT